MGQRIMIGMTIENVAQQLVRSREFHQRPQMVFRDPYASLHPRQIVDRVLTEPLRIHGIGDHEQRISRALHEVGFGPEHRFRYPHQLSGGRRQRVAIARVLIREPTSCSSTGRPRHSTFRFKLRSRSCCSGSGASGPLTSS
jgi:ABC-type microcin C transport system duplicated ATPase subunit YejF